MRFSASSAKNSPQLCKNQEHRKVWGLAGKRFREKSINQKSCFQRLINFPRNTNFSGVLKIWHEHGE